MKTLLLWNPKNFKNLVKGVSWEPKGQNQHIPPPNLSAQARFPIKLVFAQDEKDFFHLREEKVESNEFHTHHLKEAWWPERCFFFLFFQVRIDL